MNNKIIIVDAVDKNTGIARLEIGNRIVLIESKYLPEDTKGGDSIQFTKVDNKDMKDNIIGLEKKLFK